MLSEEIPAVPAALWRHLRCQQMLLRRICLVYEAVLRKRVQNIIQTTLPWSTWIIALSVLQCCSVILLIYLFIIFVTVAANRSFFVFWLRFCILFCSYSYLHYSRGWFFLGLGEGAGRERREQLCLFSEAACCPWHCAWCAEALQTWLSPSPSWALSAQLGSITCPAPELSVSQLCHLGLAGGRWRVLR